MSNLFCTHPTYVILCTAFLAACASKEPARVAAPEPVQDVIAEVEVAPEQVASPAGPIGGVAFPELQGVWLSGCNPMFEEDPEEGFQTTTVTIVGNNFTSDSTVYADSACTNNLERGFLQSGGSMQMNAVISRPGGSVSTAIGLAPHMDIDPQSFTIDNQPLKANLQPFMPLDVEYNIVALEAGSVMYLGESSDSSEVRPTELKLSARFVKQ